MPVLVRYVFRHLFALLVLLGSSQLFTGCGSGPSPSVDGDRLRVAVSILPQAEFVEKIAGDLVDVTVMIPPGASPATYEPRPRQIEEMNRCSLYFAIGVPFETAWMERMQAANPDMKVVDTSEGITRLPMSAHHHHDDDDDHDAGEHAEETANEETLHPDPHIWLSPRLVKIQAKNIERALSLAIPDQSAQLAEGLEAFSNELDTLDQTIREKLGGLEQRKFMVFHPAWGYFAEEYNLEMIPVELGGQEPSGAELAEFIDIAREERLKIILAQPEFSTRAVRTLAQEIDARVLLVSPLGLPWADNLLEVADIFAGEDQALQTKSPRTDGAGMRP
jgi:zinc transport system substrate-binding protein